MSDTKNVPIVKEEEGVVIPHRIIPVKEKEVMTAVVTKFQLSMNDRNRPFVNFDGDTLLNYIEDSVHRFTTNVDNREDIEDWQARVNTQFTRNKTIAVLGKLVQVLPIAELKGRGDEDLRKGQILSNLYEYSEDVDDYENFMVSVLLEVVTKGTAIAYEGHEKKVQKIRSITGSGDDIKIKEDEKKTNRLYGELVRLEDFYPSSVGISDVKDMPYCFWRNTIPYQTFLQDFAAYSRADLVSPYFTVSDDKVQQPEFLDYIGGTVGEGAVEIIRYYNKDVDEYIILANGVWLNPLMIKEEMVVSPIPFNHKELPFWDIKFELFEGSFFYGKSLPDKLKSIQDVMNILTNMLLDQSFLTIFPPLLTNGFDSIEDDYLRPGRRTPVDTQGLSIKDSFQVLDMGVPGNWHQFILGYMKSLGEEASVDKVSQGIAGEGDRTTAREIGIAAEGVASMLGLSGRLVKTGLKRKASLRTPNIMQFWTDKDSPMIEQVLGEGGALEMSKAFNIFKIENGVMSSGKRGTKIIEIYSDTKDMPTKVDQKVRKGLYKLETGNEIEIISVTPEYIRNFDFDIKLIANPKREETKDSEKAMQLEKVKVYLSFFPDLVDKPELAAQTAEKMGDDPTKIFKENMFPGMADEGAMKAQVDQGMSTLPQGNVANNAVRGMRGGEQGANQMQQLQNDMLG